jgi:hypothetical protein
MPGSTRNTGYLQNIVLYDENDNITLPARLAVTGTVAINNTTPYDTAQFSLDVNGGLIVKNINKTAQFVLINANPATGGNNAFVVHTVGGTSAASYADIQGYYGTSIAGSTVLRLNPLGGNVLVGSLAGTGSRMVVASSTGVLSTQAIVTLGDLSGVSTSRTITINGTTQDLSADRTFTLYTDNISEDGSPVNLWFTNTRARAAVSVSGSLSYDSATGVISYTTPSTSGITEGTNLYYTQTRFNTAFSGKSTSDLSEGTNLYYTDTRVGSYLTSNNYATQTYVGTAISNLVDAAPGTLDTLNELAAALGDDPNFATSVATSIGTKEPVITAGTTLQYWRGDKTWQTLPIYTLSGLGGVPTTRTITINGTALDLSADRSFTINSMVYPGAGIAVSTGSAWGTSITDNSSNWNTAYSWGNHASAGYLTSLPSHNHDGAYMKTNRTLDTINTIDNGGDRYNPSVNNPTNEHYAVLTYGNGGNVTGQLATHFVSGQLYSRGYNSSWSSWSKYVIENSGTWSISISGSAAQLGGYSPSGSVGANTVVIRDSNGYIFANYINSNVSESENPTINSFFTSNGDGYLRKSNIDHVRSQLGNYGGWITSYTETDTLAAVTGRGATTTAAITTGGLTVNTGGTGTWGQFVVNSTSLWGDGSTLYTTIGAGGAAGIMLYNPHVVWNSGNSCAGIRIGRSGGTSAGAYYEIGTGANDNFFIAKNALSSGAQFNINSSGNATFSGTVSASNLSGTNTGDQTNISGNAGTANTFSSSRSGYKGITDGAVAGQLMWKNYGNNHTLFDASAGTSPDGTSISRHTPTYPVATSDGSNTWGVNINLMGWNGSTTYGVKVDWSRYSESSGNSATTNQTTFGTLTINGGIYCNANNDSSTSAGGISFWSTGPVTTSWIGFKNAANSGWGYHGGYNSAGAYATYNIMDSASRGWVWRYATSGGTNFAGTNVASIQNNNGAFSTGAQWDGTSSNPIFAQINVCQGVGGATLYRDIDMKGSWGAGEGHAITATHGSSATNIVGQLVFQHDSPGSRIKLGKLYNSGDQSSYPWQLISDSNTGVSGAWVTLSGGDWSVTRYGPNTTWGAYLYVGAGTNKSGSGSAQAISTDGNLHLDCATNSKQMYLNYYAGGSAIGAYGPLNCTYDVTAYSSDKRLKTNIQPLKNALNKVLSLQGMTYNWNSVGSQYNWNPGTEREVGVFAQDVQVVLPEAVAPAPFDTDANGNSISGYNFLTVKYDKLTPLLIEAIKEQQTQIDSQKTEIEELKDLVKQLINR